MSWLHLWPVFAFEHDNFLTYYPSLNDLLNFGGVIKTRDWFR